MKYFKISLLLIFFGHIAYCSSSSNSSSAAVAAAASKNQKQNMAANNKALHTSAAPIKMAAMADYRASSLSSFFPSSAQAGNTTVKILSKEEKELKELIEHDWIIQPKFGKPFETLNDPEHNSFKGTLLYYHHAKEESPYTVEVADQCINEFSLEGKYKVYNWLLNPKHFWLQYQASVDDHFKLDPTNQNFHPLRPQGVLYYLQKQIRKEAFSLDQLKELRKKMLDTQKPRKYAVRYDITDQMLGLKLELE